MSVDNIMDCYGLADTIDIREGKVAFQRYHDSMRAMAKYHGFGFVQTVAAFAALSPNNDYMGNLRSLVSLMEGVKLGLDPKQITTSTYNQCRDRAYAYITGEADFLMCTKGPKTRAFYHNIIDPKSVSHVTIDGHMYGVWRGERFRMAEVAKMGFPYRIIEKDFKTAARRLGLIPCQLQAILWFTWKRHHNVVYSAQMDLFNHAEEDIWGLNVKPESIRGFPDTLLRVPDGSDLSTSIRDGVVVFGRLEGLAERGSFLKETEEGSEEENIG